MEPNERCIPFTSVPNFRDLGGYCTQDGRAVRWRCLFRSAAVDAMTEDEASFARDSLQIAAVFDLRSGQEVERDGVGPLPAPPVVHHHVPLLETIRALQPHGAAQPPADPMTTYLRILKEGGKAIAQALHTIAQMDGQPVLFYCTAGRDRTGVFAALLLGTLGVLEKHIVDDYTLTERFRPTIIARLSQNPAYAPVAQRLAAEAHLAPAERMSAVLDYLRAEYGGPLQYAQAHGVTPEAVARLKHGLLE